MIHELLVGNRIKTNRITGEFVRVIVCTVVAARIEASVIQDTFKHRIRISWMAEVDSWGWGNISLSGFLALDANEPTAVTGIVGKVRDGDTILVGPVPIRLQGISAPERNDPLGYEAMAFMTDLVLGKSVRCELDGNKTYDRFFGICFLGEKDVGALITLSGFALDCPRFSKGRYKNFERRHATQSIQLPTYCR